MKKLTQKGGNMKRENAVMVVAKPQTVEEKQFNLDGITFLNMLNGFSYEGARKQAIQDMRETESS